MQSEVSKHLTGTLFQAYLIQFTFPLVFKSLAAWVDISQSSLAWIVALFYLSFLFSVHFLFLSQHAVTVSISCWVTVSSRHRTLIPYKKRSLDFSIMVCQVCKLGEWMRDSPVLKLQATHLFSEPQNLVIMWEHFISNKPGISWLICAWF